jgi:transcriptional regulator with XRE-family HTH domain
MKIGSLLLRWRAAERVGVRQLANEIGISYATLSRVENGEEPGGKTLAAILRWMLTTKNS